MVLTCRAQVPNTELVRNLKWIDPEGNEVTQDSRSVIIYHTKTIILNKILCPSLSFADYSERYCCVSCAVLDWFM